MSKYSFDIPQESEVMGEFLKIAAEQNLYNVDTGEDKDGKELIEKAHPEEDSVYVTETYMTDTNLVENQTQQQKTDMEVANKMPDNKVSRKVMAESNLQEELTLIADEMSVRGEESLEAFARKVNENLQKEAIAFAPLAIAGIVAVPVVISAYLALVHWSDPVDYGIDKNLVSLYWAIEEYKETNVRGFGPESGSNIILILERLQKLSVTIGQVREKYMVTISQLSDMLIDAPKVRSDLENINPEDVKTTMTDPRSAKVVEYINKYTSEYNSYVRKMIPEFNKTYVYLSNYFETSEDLVADETGQRSTWSQIWEKTKEYAGSFAKTEEQHVLDALAAVVNSLKNDMKMRIKENSQITSTLQKPIEDKIIEKFNIEEARKDIASVNKEVE